MDFLRAFFRQYWMHVLAWIVFAFAVFFYWRRGNYLEIRNLLPIVFAFGGLVAFIGSEEWAEYTGFYGWNRDQYHNLPAILIRVVGGFALILTTLFLIRW